MVEDGEHDANDLLEIGLEQALRLKEDTIDGINPYEVDITTSDAEQAASWEAHKAAAAGVKAAAHTAWALEQRRLYRIHRDALKAVEE
jgi:hypothetical protein